MALGAVGRCVAHLIVWALLRLGPGQTRAGPGFGAHGRLVSAFGAADASQCGLDWAAHVGRSLNHRCRRARPRVELVSAPTAWDPLAGFCPRARVRWRRRRYPFLARRRWSSWPLRGTRVGEASHPGPSLTPSPGTPLGGEWVELMDLDGLAGARARSPTGDGRPAHRRRLESSGSSVRCFCPVPGTYRLVLSPGHASPFRRPLLRHFGGRS